MYNDEWMLKQIAGFFYALVRRSESKTILQKRFKKDRPVLTEFYSIIEAIDAQGYQAGVDFAFRQRYFDSVIANGSLSLVELRVRGTLWRVVMYWVREERLFVVLDAFEAHKHKSMFDVIKVIRPKVRIVDGLLEGSE
ncbi:MAG: hypothetical protein K6F70_02405 [Eggerthellaceae bacterium]|nr:hypothetical protein [Eggerthellaceae bacterium]